MLIAGIALLRRRYETTCSDDFVPPVSSNGAGEAIRLSGEEESLRVGRVVPILRVMARKKIQWHPLFLVSTVDLPVDDESLPLHILAAEPPAREREVGQFVTATEERLAAYGSIFSVFHETTWREVETMAQRSRRTFTIDISPLVETLGLKEVIRQIGEEKVIRLIGPKKAMEQLDVQTIWDNLPAAKRRQLKRLLAEE